MPGLLDENGMLVGGGGTAVLDEPILDDFDYPDHFVRDDRGRPARSYSDRSPAAQVDVRIHLTMDFPTEKVLKAAAHELNKETDDELRRGFNATSLQLGRTRKYKAEDFQPARLVAATGLTGPNQEIYATNEVMDNFAEVLHEHIPDALYQAGIDRSFELEHKHCSRTDVWGRFERIVRAAGGKCHKRWDEVYT